MSTFDKREKSAEGKFAADAEMQFKVRARRDKLLGLWAAEKLGLKDVDARDYAFSVIEEDSKLPGDADVIAKLVADFARAKVAISEAQINEQLITFENEAKRQLLG